MKIKFLRAFNGDCILINFKDKYNQNRNIIVDGGTSKTYRYKNSRGKIEDGDLKTAIDELKGKEEFIDLLILTHFDDDHIGGLLKWFENDSYSKEITKSIWFNSGSLISEYFKSEFDSANNIKLNIRDGNNTSVKQSITFEDLISEYGIWTKKLIVQGQTFELFDTIKVQILSPTYEKLHPLLERWEKECKQFLTSKETDYKSSISELIESDEWQEDKAIFNGSSIAFILEYNSKKFAFLGDAHPSIIVNGLKYYGYDKANKAVFEIVKLSHHGSKANTSIELLQIVSSKNFIISTDGKIHGLPDKRCLARIISSQKDVNLYFNYPELINQIFTEKDFLHHKFRPLKINDQFENL